MSTTCGLDFERLLSASPFEVRRAIGEALRELGFDITVDQLTRVEAKRGGMLGYSLMIKKQMPVMAVFEITPDGSGTAIAAHLTDNVKNIGKTWGINSQYRDLFDDAQRRIDLGLARLDAAAAAAFGEPRFWSRAGDIGLLEKSNVLTAKAVGGAVGAAGKVLEGSSGTTPKAWKGVDSVTFTSSAGVAVLTLAETQARLGVAVMIASHPGSMPVNLARDVESFAAAVEMKLTAAGGTAAQVEVSEALRPVYEFLNQQAEIRSGLPLRQLHICRSCRFEKITNPEYERIAARNEKIGDIVAGVGATISKGGISPTLVLGQVFKLKKLDPDYVCSRCQGMEADERVVTFCPNCADMARDVVLRMCPKCKFDYRTRAGKVPVWSAPVVEPDHQPPVGLAEGSAADAAPSVNVVPPTDPAPAPVAPAPVARAPVAPAPEAPTPVVAPPPVARPPAAPARVAPPPVAPAPVARPPAAPAPMPPRPPVAPTRVAPAPAAWPHPAQVPLGRPLMGSRGKVCQMCRREYPSLWRVVIATPAGFEERFLCGTTATCQMPSLVRAIPV